MTGRIERLAGTAPYAPGWDRTEVSRGVAVLTSVVFSLGLLAVPLADALLGAWRDPGRTAVTASAEVVRALGGGGSWWGRLVGANRAAVEGLREFEGSLEDASELAGSVRPRTLDFLLRRGGAGSEEAYVGRDAWLYYRPDVDALVMRPTGQGGAAPAIARLAADLAERGIRLVVMPVPSKAAIHPEHLSASRTSFSRPIEPAVAARLAEDVKALWDATGKPDASLAPMVFDPSGLLWESKQSTGRTQFLRTDSHWTPQAMEAVASALARIVGQPSAADHAALAANEPVEIEAAGDTALMLDLPGDSTFLAKEKVAISRVLSREGEPWQPDRSSPVLLLGDSYTNIFSKADLGWGDSAGLAEHSSRYLGFSVDRLSRNDAGARSAREMLAAEARKNPGWLEGKKVVVWELAMREVVNGDWTDVPLETGGAASDSAARPGFLVVASGVPVEVTATIEEMGPLPQPGESPYADYLTALHLTGLRDARKGAVLADSALAYAFTMRDRRVLPSASLAPGEKVKVRLCNYREKAHMLDSLNRGELDDVDVMMETPNFAEWIEPSEP